MPWSQEWKDSPVPTQKQILEIAQSIKRDDERALFVLTYLTAGRVSECLRIKRRMLKIRDVEVAKGQKEKFLIVFHMRNLKNPTDQTKTVGSPMRYERPLLETVIDYLNSLKSEDRIFPYKSRDKAWRVFRKIGLFPHMLRHWRLTHLITVYHFSDQMLTKFAGWSSSLPAKWYVQINPKELLSAMIK